MLSVACKFTKSILISVPEGSKFDYMYSYGCGDKNIEMENRCIEWAVKNTKNGKSGVIVQCFCTGELCNSAPSKMVNVMTLFSCLLAILFKWMF